MQSVGDIIFDPSPLPDIWSGPTFTAGESSATAGISDHQRIVRYMERAAWERKASSQVNRHIQTVASTYRLKLPQFRYFTTARTVNHCVRIENPPTYPYCQQADYNVVLKEICPVGKPRVYRVWPNLHRQGIDSAVQYWCREYNLHGGTHLDIYEYINLCVDLEWRFRSSQFITSTLRLYAYRWGGHVTTSMDRFVYTPVRLGRFCQALAEAYRFLPIVRFYDHALNGYRYPLLEEVHLPLGENLNPISNEFFDGDCVLNSDLWVYV